MVSSVLTNDVSELHFETLPTATKKAFLALSENADWLNTGGWYLAGGTALALQVGHRTSVDLDFFTTEKNFDSEELERKLASIGDWKPDLTESGTLYGKFMGAKMSFIAYPHFHPSPNKLQYGALKLISPDDIAVMKIIAISQRGRKRDFVDMFWYCHNLGNLGDTLRRTLIQFPQEHNKTHLLKSLTYFVDADNDPMPNINFTVTWNQVKAYFQKEIPILTRKMLDLD